MTKRKMVGLIIIPVMVLSLASSRAQQWPVSGFYQIISGGYSQCFEVCFGLGDFLPDANQSFVELVSLLSSLLVALKRNLLFGREQGEGSEYASSGPCIMSISAFG